MCTYTTLLYLDLACNATWEINEIEPDDMNTKLLLEISLTGTCVCVCNVSYNYITV